MVGPHSFPTQERTSHRIRSEKIRWLSKFGFSCRVYFTRATDHK